MLDRRTASSSSSTGCSQKVGIHTAGTVAVVVAAELDSLGMGIVGNPSSGSAAASDIAAVTVVGPAPTAKQGILPAIRTDSSSLIHSEVYNLC